MSKRENGKEKDIFSLFGPEVKTTSSSDDVRSRPRTRTISGRSPKTTQSPFGSSVDSQRNPKRRRFKFSFITFLLSYKSILGDPWRPMITVKRSPLHLPSHPNFHLHHMTQRINPAKRLKTGERNSS